MCIVSITAVNATSDVQCSVILQEQHVSRLSYDQFKKVKLRSGFILMYSNMCVCVCVSGRYINGMKLFTYVSL